MADGDNNTGRTKVSFEVTIFLCIICAVLFFIIGRISVTQSIGSVETDSLSTADSSAEIQQETSDQVVKKEINLEVKKKRDEAQIPPASIGEEVTNNAFSFKVTGIDSSKGFVFEVDGTEKIIKPEGQFFIVSLQIQNITKLPATPLPTHMKLADIDGFEYDVSGKTLPICESNPQYNTVLAKELKPGKGNTGVVVFDVPTLKNSYRLEIFEQCIAGKKVAEVYL